MAVLATHISSWRYILTLIGLPARSQLKPPDDQSVLNAKRPANPFILTKEPDWVIVSKAAEGKPGVERSTKDGAQPGSAKNTREPQSTYDRGPNSSTSADLDHINDQNFASTSRSRPTSQDPARSDSSAVLRKIAPPVPRKPSLLSRAGDQDPGKHDHSIYSSGQKNADSTTTFPSLTSNAETTPLPRRIPGTRSFVHDRGTLQSRPPEENGPQLPPRKPADSQSSMGLMDEDVKGASSIPSLQPQRQL